MAMLIAAGAFYDASNLILPGHPRPGRGLLISFIIVHYRTTVDEHPSFPPANIPSSKRFSPFCLI